jgi:hypothetical protein
MAIRSAMMAIKNIFGFGVRISIILSLIRLVTIGKG